MQQEIRVKKTTLRKIVAVICVIVLVSASFYYIYQKIVLPRSRLIEQIAFLRDEINNRTFEKEQLDMQVADLQEQISNLTQIINPQYTNITQLNSEINKLNDQLDNLNQAITRLNNELLEANSIIQRLQKEIEAGQGEK